MIISDRTKKYCEEHNITNKKTVIAIEKSFRRGLKKIGGSRPLKPTKSLQEEPRYRFDEEDTESYSEIGFLPFKADETITHENILYYYQYEMEQRIYSQWDCTGQIFSRGFRYHINPNGMISYVHDLGIDI